MEKPNSNLNPKRIFLSLVLFMFIFFTLIPSSHAAVATTLNWWPLPPYNTLWPLWSPVLSPPNVLGVPQPVVTSLTQNTVLPVQPGLTWDPVNQKYPWLLYNTPLGMVYYDPLFGIDLWPPSYMQSPLGLPLPLNLSLVKWSTLLPTSTAWLQTNVPIGNNTYYTTYPQYAPLLTPASIVGLTLI